jgi:integrase
MSQPHEVALPHIRQAVMLALDTGMRRGEILSLRRELLDAHRRVLVVSRSKTAGGTGRDIPWTARLHDLRHTFNTRLMEAGVSQDIRKALELDPVSWTG